VCEFYESGTRIGGMRFVRIRNYTSDPAWEAADSDSSDIESVVSVCTDPAYSMTPGLHWSEDFEEAIEMPVGDLLIMDRVRIDPEWRGFGIGALAAAEATRRLSGGCCAVACEPAPTDREFVGEDDAAFTEAQSKIAKVWESVGFKPFKDGIYLLDTAMQHKEDRRIAWQKHFAR
jgi:GNAT superfamily N-acetyltransferase